MTRPEDREWFIPSTGQQALLAAHRKAVQRSQEEDAPDLSPDQQAPDLEAIRERLARATPGPWEVGGRGWDDDLPSVFADDENGGDPWWICRCDPDAPRSDMGVENATFIACARTDISVLLAHIDRQQAEIDRLSNLCEFSAGSPEARLRAVFEFAEAECGHDGYSSICASTTIRRFVAELKAEIDRLTRLCEQHGIDPEGCDVCFVEYGAGTPGHELVEKGLVERYRDLIDGLLFPDGPPPARSEKIG